MDAIIQFKLESSKMILGDIVQIATYNTTNTIFPTILVECICMSVI